MKLYYPITVDLYKPYPLPLVETQQNNIGRGVLVTLTAQGAVITPTGESIQLYAKKPDGTISYLACTLTGSQIECDFTNQMLALPGMVQVELQMIGGESGAETEITTPIFCVKVNPSNVDDSAVESQDEFPALGFGHQILIQCRAQVAHVHKACGTGSKSCSDCCHIYLSLSPFSSRADCDSSILWLRETAAHIQYLILYRKPLRFCKVAQGFFAC